MSVRIGIGSLPHRWIISITTIVSATIFLACPAFGHGIIGRLRGFQSTFKVARVGHCQGSTFRGDGKVGVLVVGAVSPFALVGVAAKGSHVHAVGCRWAKVFNSMACCGVVVEVNIGVFAIGAFLVTDVPSVLACCASRPTEGDGGGGFGGRQT